MAAGVSTAKMTLRESQMNIKEKSTALITGATSGIGAEYARRFAREGYDLIITGRREAKIKALADQLSRENNVSVEVILIELSDAEAVDEFLERIKDREIDVLVNNAGFGTLRFFHREPLQTHEDMVAVNILCAIRLTYAILPKMLKKRDGIIINVSSAGAYLPTPNEATYNGTKAFLRAFSEALYFELIGTGVKIQAVCPGLTKTDMPIRLGIPEDQIVDRGPFKWITPEQVVDASLKCLKKNKVICIPGQMTRLQVFVRSILPDSLYYKYSYAYFKKYGWLEEPQQEKG
jgi:short-subunit dehydrogenase